jgi:adenylate cyclase
MPAARMDRRSGFRGSIVRQFPADRKIVPLAFLMTLRAGSRNLRHLADAKGVRPTRVGNRMRKWKNLRSYLPIVAGAYALMLFVNTSSMPLHANLENLVFDEYQRLRPRPYAFDEPVRIVDIDDESIQRIGQWPWPRRKMATLVDELTKANVAAVGFDVLFSEKERSDGSPVASGVFQVASQDAPSAVAMNAPDEGDAAFANAISDRRVVLGSILSRRDVGNVAGPKIGFATVDGDPAEYVSRFSGVLSPLPVLADAAGGVGYLNWIPDADRVIRSVPLLSAVKGKLQPSFVLEALRVAQAASTYVVKCLSAAGGAGLSATSGVGEIRVGDVTIATQPGGDVRAYFAAADSRRSLPAWKIFEQGADLSDLEGKIVVVGASASLLSDVVATPLNPSTPGVEAEAQLLEQILSGASLRRPDWAPGAELLAAATLSLAFILMLPAISGIWSALFGAVASVVLFAASWFVFTRNGILLDPVIPSVSSGMVFLSGTLSLYSQKRHQVTEIRSAFGRYVSPAVVSQLAERPENLRLGGLQRPLTLMFCDLRSFTTISEGFSATELTSFLNEYLTPMTTVILDQNGTVDKYMGDAIMSFWNAPLDDAHHALHAVQAALKMRDALAEFNRQWAGRERESGRPYPTVKFGVGLNTGECCVGNLGSHQRFDYSAIGDEVNVASRLEGASKMFGVDIVASASTVDEAPGFGWLEIDQVLLKGKTRPVSIFALAGNANYAASIGFQELSERHEAILSAYRAREFSRAESLAAEAESGAPEEVKGLYGYYVERFQRLSAAGVDPSWRPMIALTEK